MSRSNLNLFARLARGWRWIAAQFLLTLVLILIAIAWTRLPDKHFWQVGLTLLVPLLLAISALELQAGTVRAFSDDDGRRVKLIWGALALLVWLAVGAACWAFLDWCDDRIFLWAGYLNSKMSTHARATTFTYEHITHWLTLAEWILRWIVVPAKLIAWGAASALWGWRLPVRRIIRLLFNWRWWLGVIAVSLVAVLLPSHLFAAPPPGSVKEQVWAVILKLILTYVLVVGSWVLLLGWWATLFKLPPAPSAGEELVGVPAFTGPPDRELKARAFPPADDETEV